MDLKQLRTFQAVAELGSLSKAADRLRATQPALSRHIKLLEHELRVITRRRFDRRAELSLFARDHCRA
jgi:DNA-binding transcriptional LysR family regulator